MNAQVPPNDLDAEAAVLAAPLLDVSTLAHLSHLEPHHFYSTDNRRVWGAIRDAFDRDGVVDIVTVKNHLNGKGRDVGPYLAELLAKVPSVSESNLRAYAQIVYDKWRLRQTIASAQLIEAQGYTATDADELEQFARATFNETHGNTSTGFQWIADPFEPLPPIVWTCRDLMLCSGRPALWSGYGYSGKSIITQSLMLAIASGSRLWGQFHVQHGPVVHLDYEQGRRATLLRYQRLARVLGVDTPETAANLQVCCLPRIYLTTQGAEDLLLRTLDGKAAALIDSLRAATEGQKENDSEFRRWLDLLNRVGDRTGCQVNVNHHGVKGGGDKDPRERARGSSAIFDACGAVFDVGSKEPNDPKRVENSKTGAEAPGAALSPFYLKFEDVCEDSGIDPAWGLRVVYMTVEQVKEPKSPGARLDDVGTRIVEVLKSKPHGASQRVIRALTAADNNLIGASLDLLVADGRVIKEPRKGRGGGYNFRVEQPVCEGEE